MLICLAVLTYKPYSEYTYIVQLEKEYCEIVDRYVPYEELSEDDQRVIGLIVDGIGHEDTDATVAAECRWMETVKE